MPENHGPFPPNGSRLPAPAHAAMARSVFVSVAALSLALVLSACSRDESAPAGSPVTAGKTAQGNPLLRYVPAQSPYFLVTVERIPKAVALAHAARSAYDRDKLLAELRETAASEQGDAAQAVATLIRLVELLPERFDEAGFASLGLRPDAHVALYGIGLMPVLRFEIGNREAFQSLIDRLFATLEVTPERARRGDREWWRASIDPLTVHVAVGEADATFTAAPIDFPADQLDRLLGDQLPERHLGQSGRLEEIVRLHRFIPYQVGRIDTAAILSELAQPSLAAARFEAAQGVLGRAECRQEFESLARRYPGIDLGMRRFDEKNIELAIVFRTEPGLAADLGKLAPLLPRLDTPAPLADLGFGLRFGELSTLLGRWAQTLDQAPYRCDALHGLNELAGAFRTAATNPGTAMISAAGDGAMVRLDKLDLSDLNNPDFAGTVILVSSNPQGTLGLLAGAMPEVANLGLVVGGEPTAVPAELLGPPVRTAFAGLGERSAVVSFNHPDATSVKTVLAAPVDPRQRMLVIDLSGRLLGILAEAMRRAAGEGGADPNLLLQASQLERFAQELASASIVVQISAEGVEMLLTSVYR
jgi:hypothetical protein